MKRSLDINQVQNLPMNNNNNDTIDDIEDEEEINNNIPNAGLMNGEDVNLVQASKDYIDAVRSIANNPWDHISWFMYLEEVNIIVFNINNLLFELLLIPSIGYIGRRRERRLCYARRSIY